MGEGRGATGGWARLSVGLQTHPSGLVKDAGRMASAVVADPEMVARARLRIEVRF